jgi:hypothetical protein
MSPQMNGEPREEEVTGTSRRASTPVQPSAAEEGEQPMLPAIDTSGLTQTTAAKDDAKLAPLFTQETAQDFRSRWDLVQRSFVDDPREAVHAADELVAQVSENLAQTFANQRSALEKGWDQAEQPTTENLRIALRQYRSFFDRLLSI